MRAKNAIALLITLVFIIAITVAVGISLKQVKKASQEINNENFIIQTSVILDDVLSLLKRSIEIEQIVSSKSVDGLYIFLSQAGFIPFESSGVKISLELTSARSKMNINTLMDVNSSSVNLGRVTALQEYMSQKMVNIDYVTILLDVMGGVKEDMSYNSALINEHPEFFRDYISSQRQLEEINNFYMREYRDNSLKNIELQNLFYFSEDKNTSIDLNYATLETWELLLNCERVRAEELVLNAGMYTDLESLDLSSEEQSALTRFNVSYFEPHLDIKVEISQNESSASIQFEYDMKTKKGSNFVYEI